MKQCDFYYSLVEFHKCQKLKLVDKVVQFFYIHTEVLYTFSIFYYKKSVDISNYERLVFFFPSVINPYLPLLMCQDSGWQFPWLNEILAVQILCSIIWSGLSCVPISHIFHNNRFVHEAMLVLTKESLRWLTLW